MEWRRAELTNGVYAGARWNAKGHGGWAIEYPSDCHLFLFMADGLDVAFTRTECEVVFDVVDDEDEKPAEKAELVTCPLCGKEVHGLLVDALSNEMCKECWKEIHGLTARLIGTTTPKFEWANPFVE